MNQSCSRVFLFFFSFLLPLTDDGLFSRRKGGLTVIRDGLFHTFPAYHEPFILKQIEKAILMQRLAGLPHLAYGNQP
jgi:hypothetical protein